METSTKVVSCRKKNGKYISEFDIYIGRNVSRGHTNFTKSKWFNPYKVGKDGTIEDVLYKYKSYVLSQPNLVKDLYELKGKRLACWCKIQGHEPCHGDVLVELLQHFP